MVNYRRNRLAGGTYFFTVALRDRRATYLTTHVNLLRLAFRHAHQTRPFHINAIAVLPEHLHAIWTLPAEDYDYAYRWRLIKSCFARALAGSGANIVCNAKGEYDVWQRRYWEHTIRDNADLQRHVDYIHYNSVKHGLVSRVADWPYSSFHRYVRNGMLAADWAGMPDEGGVFGE